MAKRGNGKNCVSAQDVADEAAAMLQKASARAAMLRAARKPGSEGSKKVGSKPAGTPSKPQNDPANTPSKTLGQCSVASTLGSQ